MRRLLPEPIDIVAPGLFQGDRRQAANVSGIWCLPEDGGRRRCFIATDERFAIQEVELRRRANDEYVCEPGAVAAAWWGQGEEEGDLEALAADARHLYATGFWGAKRQSGAIVPHNWTLLRRPLDAPDESAHAETAGYTQLVHVFRAAFPELAWSADCPLQCGGLNIEGLTVFRDRLWFGLRSPSLRKLGIAYVFDVDASWIFSPDEPLGEPPHLHRLPFRLPGGAIVEALGIRALETIDDDTMLIGSGDAGVAPPDGAEDRAAVARLCEDHLGNRAFSNLLAGMPFMIWSWRPGSDPAFLGAVAGVYGGKKLEGLALLSRRTGTADVLLAFDDPADGLSPLALLRDLPFPAGP